jgi:hypothetical protein
MFYPEKDGGKNSKIGIILICCTRSRNRTDILVKELVFETSASTNSAIRAGVLKRAANLPIFLNLQGLIYTKLCRS